MNAKDVNKCGGKWECHLCAKEEGLENLPYGYLGNYHPLCERCADRVLIDEGNRHHGRLTYHKKTGDILINII
jgi:hypothetical protein